mmetsp:Transcript_19983/g.63235  ORF Transcript_19983/g.63235 Transcript_19983/m.63235 type:complete len:315 (+) Transcript_19983:857-1801(+)
MVTASPSCSSTKAGPAVGSWGFARSMARTPGGTLLPPPSNCAPLDCALPSPPFSATLPSWPLMSLTGGIIAGLEGRLSIPPLRQAGRLPSSAGAAAWSLPSCSPGRRLGRKGVASASLPPKRPVDAGPARPGRRTSMAAASEAAAPCAGMLPAAPAGTSWEPPSTCEASLATWARMNSLGGVGKSLAGGMMLPTDLMADKGRSDSEASAATGVVADKGANAAAGTMAGACTRAAVPALAGGGTIMAAPAVGGVSLDAGAAAAPTEGLPHCLSWSHFCRALTWSGVMPHSSRMSVSFISSTAAIVSKPLSTNLSK